MRALVLLFCLLLPARAHMGAPYVVLLDEPFGAYRVTVWSDPDVGEGTFYLVAMQGEKTAAPPPARLWVRASNEKAELGPFETRAEEWGRRPSQAARVPFDREGDWEVRLESEGHTARFRVLVTPPGPPWLSWVLGLGPCLLLAALWAWGARRARARRS